MYIESLEVTNFRCFEQASVLFEYHGRHTPSKAPRLPNVNLILGDNGTGKSAVLTAITLGVLGRVIQSSGFRPYMLVRRHPAAVGETEASPVANSGVRRVRVHYVPSVRTSRLDRLAFRVGSEEYADVEVTLRLHPQDVQATPDDWGHDLTGSVTGQVLISRVGDTEAVTSSVKGSPARWQSLFEDFSPAFFMAAYGASRRVASSESFDPGARDKSRAPRYQRVAGLFEEAVSLTPVSVWAKEFFTSERLQDGLALLNSLLPEGVRAEKGLVNVAGIHTPLDVEFNVRGTLLPFAALSDGYRGFVGWVVDLLYQMGRVTPLDRALTDLCGVVIVDELDLLLHPAWQRTVIEKLATTFPRLQFFFTSHSPIVVGTLEAANLIVTEVDEGTGQVRIDTSRERVYGLSADQVLSSRYFGLASSRAPGAEQRLRDLAERAIEDDDAAEEYLRLLADGEDATAPAKAPRNGERRAR